MIDCVLSTDSRQHHVMVRDVQAQLGLDTDPDAPLFAFVGRWTYEKGIDLLADAIVAAGLRSHTTSGLRHRALLPRPLLHCTTLSHEVKQKSVICLRFVRFLFPCLPHK